MKQEGATEVEKKATGKGIAGSRRTASGSSGGEAVKSQKLAEGDKAEAGKGRRFPVSQKYIDMLLKEKATGTGAYKVSRSMEYIEKYYKGTRDFRSLVARSDAAMEKVRAGDAKILDQYERFGCAYREIEEEDDSVSLVDEEKIRRFLSRWPPVA